jgi:hypothetical protein
MTMTLETLISDILTEVRGGAHLVALPRDLATNRPEVPEILTTV